MQDDFSPLDAQMELWTTWLGSHPAQVIRAEIEKMLRAQIPSTSIQEIRVLTEPAFVAGGPQDRGSVEVRRVSISLPFELQAESNRGLHRVTGVFSWVSRLVVDGWDTQVYLDLEPGLWGSNEYKLLQLERLHGLASRSEPSRRPWWQFWRRPG